MNNLETIQTLRIKDTIFEIVDEQLRTNIHNIRYAWNIETDAKYFDIDYDGILSLKPEYRGDPYKDYDPEKDGPIYPFSVSDNDLGNEGSKINELPERIVIPYAVNEIAVTGFQDGMFKHNKRIKELRLPKTVYTIPTDFCYEAFNLEVLENTEHIESIAYHGFSRCAIKKAIFPNLKSLGKAFIQDPFLVIADIGNYIENLPNAFQDCANLSCVLGGGSITTVAVGAFKGTRSLKNLPFLSQLTSIGDIAFFDSRVNFDAVYDTLIDNKCYFGINATYKQVNIGADEIYNNYWAGVEYTPCENPLGSLFHQKDPRWATDIIYKPINNETFRYGYNGCGFVTMAEIFSALEGVEFSSPKQFEDLLKEKGFLEDGFRSDDEIEEIYTKLGYQVERIKTMTSEGLQKVYDALADGALIHKTMGTYEHPDWGHAILVYGVNSLGKLLIADSDVCYHMIEEYENHKSSMPIYALGTAACNTTIVKKKPKETTDQ